MSDRFWVGGSGNWSDNTNHWAASSGGAPGASLPGSTDDVFFDTLSNASSYTCTIDATTKLCRNITFGAPLAGNVTWAGSVAMTISGSMTLYAGLVRTFTGNLTFNATDSRTLTFAGTTMSSATVFNGSGGTWTVQDNWNNDARSITLTQGTLDTNGKTITYSGFSSTGSLTRVLTLGASTLTSTGDWTVSGSGYTINAGTSTINITVSGLDFIGGSGVTYSTANLTTTGDSTAGIDLHDSNTFTNLGLLISSGTLNSQVIIHANQTITGTLTITGANAGTGMAFVKSDVIGTVRTLTAATTSLTNANFRDITAAGAASWTGTQLGDLGGNTGITTDTPKSRFWVGGTGNWSATSEWAATSGGASGASIPLPQDTIVFDANSFTAAGQTATCNMLGMGKNVSFTGVLNSPTFTLNATGGSIITGDLTFVSGMTFTQADPLYFGGRGTHTITSAGKSFGSGALGDVYFRAGIGGSYTIQDSFSCTRDLIFEDSTFNANGFNVTASRMLFSDSTRSRTINMGSGNWTCTGANVTEVWDMGTTTGLTLNAGTSTIIFNDASATGKVFKGGNATFYNLYLTGAGTGTFAIEGSNTFNQLRCDTPPHTITFQNGSVTTLTTLTINGTAGNLMTVMCVSAGTFTLSKTSGNTDCDYLSISDCLGRGGARWFVGKNSIDGGDNNGLRFAGASNRQSGGTSNVAYL